MFRTRKGALTAAIVSCVCALGSPQSAKASLMIALQQAGVNGGAITVVATAANFTNVSFSGNYGSFAISVFGGSSNNGLGGGTFSNLLSSTTSVSNTTGSAATLHLWVTQTDYTLPVGTQLSIESGLGGSVSVPTLTLAGIYQAWADRNNNAFGTTDFTNGLQNASQTGSTFDTGSAVGFFTRTGNFSLTSEANFALTGGGFANFSAHINVAAVPEPATMVSAIVGLSSIGLFRFRRRKSAESV
jgi:hypothetical protein